MTARLAVENLACVRGGRMLFKGISFALGAGDALLLYFHSRNIPTPNRMNWKDPETDRLLDTASAALNEKDRFENFGKVQKIIHENVLWMPILYEGVQLVNNKKIKNVKAHNVYATMIYKALDFTP